MTEMKLGSGVNEEDGLGEVGEAEKWRDVGGMYDHQALGTLALEF